MLAALIATSNAIAVAYDAVPNDAAIFDAATYYTASYDAAIGSPSNVG